MGRGRRSKRKNKKKKNKVKHYHDGNWFTKLKSAVNKVLEDYDKMSDEEFEKEIEKYKPKYNCSPDDCNGECQGMGDCEIAKSFRSNISPKIIDKPHMLGCRCRICKKVLKLHDN